MGSRSWSTGAHSPLDCPGWKKRGSYGVPGLWLPLSSAPVLPFPFPELLLRAYSVHLDTLTFALRAIHIPYCLC